MILYLGSAADRTFVHTLEVVAQAGAAFDAFDLGQLAYSGGARDPTRSADEIVLDVGRRLLAARLTALPPPVDKSVRSARIREVR